MYTYQIKLAHKELNRPAVVIINADTQKIGIRLACFLLLSNLGVQHTRDEYNKITVQSVQKQ